MSQAKQQLIIEAHSNALHVVLMRRNGSMLECVARQRIDLAELDANRSSLQHQVELDRLQAVIEEAGWAEQAQLTVLVSGTTTACHYFEMPALGGKELTEAVRLKLAQQMHFPLNEAIVDVARLSEPDKSKKSVVARAAVMRSEVSEAAVAFARALGTEAVTVTTSALALHALADRTITANDGANATLLIDSAHSTLMVSGPDGPVLTTELALGEREFIGALMRPIIAGDDMVQLESDDAMRLWREVGIPQPDQFIVDHDIEGRNLLPLLEPVLQRYAQQLIQWLTFVSTSDGGLEIKQLNLVGSAASIEGLSDALASRLKLDVGVVPWLESVATDSSGQSDIAPISAACGALINGSPLPNLISRQEKQTRRIRRICKSTTVVGPIVAAAMLAFAFLINQTSGGLQSAAGSVNQDLGKMRELEARNQKLLMQRNTAHQMQTEIDQFSEATPNWLGLMKELSYILPKGVAIERLTGRQVDGSLRVAIEALAVASAETSGCDEMIEKTLQALENSPFSKAVHLINVGRSDPRSGQNTARLNVEIELVYRKPVLPGKEARS